MSCGSCGSSSSGLPKGCKNNGACGVDTGCGKLPVFDWLSNMRLPNGQLAFNCVEVRFKNDRKQYYINSHNLPLGIGDVVAVEAQSGHDIGVVTLTGELVRIQMKKRKLTENSEEVKKIYRKANEKDIETWQAFRAKEQETKMRARRIAVNLGLEMKITDVEYQGDGTKAIFYYTAEGRVDFRELIKQYAAAFSVRIEMKQIGYRQEAAKVGGIGSCGRELCCSTWLTDFRSVNTAAARYQQLSINPQKLAGQCGKLKCCLNYELDSYLDALDEFPSMETTFETEKGTAGCMKIDVFKKEMWFAYTDGGFNWYKFSLDQIKDYIAISKKGGKTATLEDLEKDNIVEVKNDFVDVIEENSLERFERKNRNRNKSRNRQDKQKQKPNTNLKSNNNRPERNQKTEKAGDNKEKQNRPNRNRRTEKPKNENRKTEQKNKPVNKQQNPTKKQPKNQNQETKPNPNKPSSSKPNPNKQNQSRQPRNKKRNNRDNPNKDEN
ncbi:regulatory iron-sulfur-containing complex subunit RicT [Moheibacter lacus]|uniref:PSP1 C-terminal domain-containing protein n=1 Tax=Moheibacter lacus TaxID=2745851 RepID=A0A838ZQ64_9FLAO|nr:regulatory iron-sulfur-containing complex subunit RicT [Moheibacter lacus]MBA5629175.1 hypothetical protein [Moheibacter lacus]